MGLMYHHSTRQNAGGSFILAISQKITIGRFVLEIWQPPVIEYNVPEAHERKTKGRNAKLTCINEICCIPVYLVRLIFIAM